MERCDIGVDLSQTFDQLLNEMLGIFFGIQVNGFILFEPGLVVILFEIFEKFESRSFNMC